jgi:NTE family protein
LILDQIALPYSQLKSFSDLPIPFACVATDLVTRDSHIFRSGPLDVALRSTMSLPGIFTPVVSDGHIYVDGGILNNFPTSVAKEMGADVILGVHLQIAPLDPEKHLSSFEVLAQSIAVVIATTNVRRWPRNFHPQSRLATRCNGALARRSRTCNFAACAG